MSKNDGFFPVNKTLGRTLLVIATCVSLILLGTIVAIVREEVNNRARYQMENYAKFSDNILSIQPLIEAVAGYAETIETESLYAIPFFVTAGPDEVAAQLSSEPGENPFVVDSMGYKVTGRLRGLIYAGSYFDTVVLYAPASGYYLGTYGEPQTNFAFDNLDALQAALNMEPMDGFPYLASGTWFAADPFPGDGKGRLMIAYALDNGMRLFCSVSPRAIEESLFADVYGRSYEYLGAYLALENGNVMSGDGILRTDTALQEAQKLLGGEETIGHGRDFTIMRYNLRDNGAQLLAFCGRPAKPACFPMGL